MKTVAWAILVMGISIVLVIVLWLSFGHIGPSYSAGILQTQQTILRKQYGLPTQQTSSSQLEVPPSLRGIENKTSVASTSAGNQTANPTVTENKTSFSGGNKTTSASSPLGGGIKVSVTEGAAAKTTQAFDPNPVKAKVGDTVSWANGDSIPHTVTSGSSGKPDGKFDSSPGLKSLLTPGKTFSHKFSEAGNYQYYCQLHPNMVGTVSVS